MRALEARMEGFEVMPALAAAERGDVFVTVTGNRDVLSRDALRAHEGRRAARQRGPLRRRDRPRGAARRCRRRAARGAPARRRSSTLGERRLNLLASGRVVNLAAGAGPPRRGDGHVVRQPGARRRAPRARRRAARRRACTRCPRPSTARSRGSSSRRSACEIDTLSRRRRRTTCAAGWDRTPMSAEGLQASVEKMRAGRRPGARDRDVRALLRAARGGRVGHDPRGHDRAGRASCPTPTRCPRATPPLDQAVVIKLNGGLGTSMGMSARQVAARGQGRARRSST